MSARTHAPAPGLDIATAIDAPPNRVFTASFELAALQAWCQVSNAVTTPRLLGPYVVEWPPSEVRDDVLGRLGGVFRGTIVHIEPGHSFFVADAYWLPPEGEPIGPMALEVVLTNSDLPSRGSTRVHVTQRGFDESVRWRRYYEVIQVGWDRALASLKGLLEH